MRTLHSKLAGDDRPGFTLVELLVVISIIGILAGLVVGLSKLASQKTKESRLQTEMNQIITAIDSYHADKGFYPPDVKDSEGRVVPQVNALFYELVGTVYTNRLWQPLNGTSAISRLAVVNTFNAQGFANSSTDRAQVKSYLNPKQEQHRLYNATTQVHILASPYEFRDTWRKVMLPPIANSATIPWFYDASTPGRHNPQSYDLWTEIVYDKDKVVIGNWNQ